MPWVLLLLLFPCCYALIEVELWKYVDAPVLIGGEHLSACDFVKIFQVDMESMSQSAAR